MANIYPFYVEFKDTFNTDLNLITAVSFNGSFDTPTANVDMEPVYTERPNGTHIVYGNKFTSPAQVTITFVKKDYKVFTTEESRQFLKWLGGHKKADWLKLYDKDMEEICEYLGSFTEILEQTADSLTLGYMATFTSVTPWAFSHLREVHHTFTGTEKIVVYSDGDIQDYIIRPYMTIKPLNTDVEQLSITNTSTNRTTILKNIKKEEILTLDNENKIVFSNNSLRVVGSDFIGDIDGFITNYPVFLELDGYTDNELIFTTIPSSANVSYSLQYRYPIQIGATF